MVRPCPFSSPPRPIHASRFLAASLCIVSGLLSDRADAATWYVERNNPLTSDSNPGTAALPWTTIQHGVDSAAAGDTIIVRAGDYSGPVSVYKSVGIYSQGGRMVGPGTGMAFVIQADDVTIEGFHIENYIAGIAPLDYGGAFARARIRLNYLTRVGYGIWIRGDGWLVEGNEVDRILLGGEDYAAIFGTNHVVRRNFFHGTHIPEDLGAGPDYAHNDCMQFWNNNGEVLHDVVIEENIFTDFVQGLFMANEMGVVSSMSNITVRNNVFWGTNFFTGGNLIGWPSHGTFFGKAPIPGVVVRNNLYRNIGNCVSLYAMNTATAAVDGNIIVDAGTAYAFADNTDITSLDRGTKGNVLWNNGWNGNPDQGPDKYINPQLKNIGSLIGADGVPWTLDDGWRPLNSQAAAYGPQVTPSASRATQMWADLRNNFKLFDINHDGLLNQAESTLAPVMFSLFDRDHNSRLSMSELLQASAGPAGVANPVYVDFNYTGWEDGSLPRPFNSLLEAANFVAPQGTVAITQGSTAESIRITGPMTLLRGN